MNWILSKLKILREHFPLLQTNPLSQSLSIRHSEITKAGDLGSTFIRRTYHPIQQWETLNKPNEK